MGKNLNRELSDALKEFSESVTAKFGARTPGEPEAQLKAPFERLFKAYGNTTSQNLLLKDESAIDRLGRPDYAVERDGLLIGYIELKEPAKSADTRRLKGHDAEQWERFRNIPNILYCTGNEWALYRDGKLFTEVVRVDGDVCSDGKKAIDETSSKKIFSLLTEFLSWMPIVPKKPKELASFLAPFCRLIRDDVMDSLQDPNSAMQSLKEEIKKLLFPEAEDLRFADAYAQTVVFALLLAHLEDADVLDLNDAYETLDKHHSLLSRSLQFLTDKEAKKEISTSLTLTQRVIHEIPLHAMRASRKTQDPWLYFYEDFLAEYDPELRKKSGVYYTPLEVTQCQVTLIDEILRKEFGKEMGFVEDEVATLDPAVGTGTYLLTIIDHALKRIEDVEGEGAVKGGARALVKNIFGFEWMVGPYAVAQLRLSQEFAKHEVRLAGRGPQIYLTNTLESPHTVPPAPALFHKPIAEEHKNALEIKESKRVLVCLGNPPYGRHESSDENNKETTGAWVRYGDEGETPILENFLKPARDAGYGVHLKNIYNHYVYFIRWALWKVFEHKTAVGPGIVSFITASSYLDGDAFAGVREHMRKICDHIDIIDLGGENRGTRQSENVFSIETPVAIFVAWRKKKKDSDKPAVVRYTRIEGTRDEKLEKLSAVKGFASLKWEVVPDEWQAPFRPESKGAFSKWPKITDMFPWQSNGVQCKRTWPIAPEKETLEVRWSTLLDSEDRAGLMRESGDRTVSLKQVDILDFENELPPISTLKKTPPHSVVRYSYRSFDRQFILADNRLISRPRPHLWHAHSENQIYLGSLFSIPLGGGPALVVGADIPDLDFFRGSYGAKAAIPLYLDNRAEKVNITPGMLELLGGITAEDFAGYVYCILAHPEYTRRFEEELVNREVRVPLTKDRKLFAQAAGFGKKLIWLHTYGERFWNKKDCRKGKVPGGSAKCLKAVPDSEEKYPNDYSYDDTTKTILVGDGAFGAVSPEVWEFEVSGFKVVQSWLGYRMKDRKGKKSSPLDDIHPRSWTHDFTREFLELLWVLEKTIEGYPEQKKIFERVLKSELFKAGELPPVPEELREGPKIPKGKRKQMEIGEQE